MQNDWFSNEAEGIQGYADRKYLKRFYDTLKTPYGLQALRSSRILRAVGKTLVTNRAKILERWAEHSNAVLNRRPSSISDKAIQRLPQVPINHDLDAPPTLMETQKAVSQLPSGKAPGIDDMRNSLASCLLLCSLMPLGDFKTNVRERVDITLSTKLEVCQAVDFTTLLYACESCTVTADMPDS